LGEARNGDRWGWGVSGEEGGEVIQGRDQEFL